VNDFDIVSLQNGNLHLSLPITSVPQRGKPLSWSFVYDTPSFSASWVDLPPPPQGNGRYGIKSVLSNWYLSDPFRWQIDSPSVMASCGGGQNNNYQYVVTDPDGGKHPMALRIGLGGQSCLGEVDQSPALDGSGIFVKFVRTTETPLCCFTIYTK